MFFGPVDFSNEDLNTDALKIAGYTMIKTQITLRGHFILTSRDERH